MSKIIDARGRSCPEPVIMTKSALDTNPNGDFKVLVDTFVAKENIERFVTGKGYKVKIKEVDEEFEISIKK